MSLDHKYSGYKAMSPVTKFIAFILRLVKI